MINNEQKSIFLVEAQRYIVELEEKVSRIEEELKFSKVFIHISLIINLLQKKIIFISY